MLSLLQDASRTALPYALSAFVQATALALVIGALDLAFGRHLRASLRHALWLLVVLKLILPPTLELPTSAAWWIARFTLKPREVRAVAGLPPDLATAWEMTPAEPPAILPLHRYGQRPTFDPAGLLLLAWLAGSAALALAIARRQHRVGRLLRTASPGTPEVEALLTQATREAGLSRRPRLLLTAENHSPAVCGLLRPTLLLPRSLVDAVAPDVLRHVLLHELVHIRRRDLWINALQVGVQVLCWWNPVAWFANARVRALRELAVDDQVQHLRGEQNPTGYPAALVEVARHCSAQPLLALSFVGILESSRTLKQRVERLLTHPTPTRPHLGGRGWLTVLTLALLVVPMGFSRRVLLVAADPAAVTPAVAGANTLKVECLPDGRFQLDDRILELAPLQAELKRRAAADQALTLFLQSTPEAPMTGVLDVVKAAQAAGITRLSILTTPASTKPGATKPAAAAPGPRQGRDQIRAGLESVRLSGLHFAEALLGDVVEELDSRSRAADPSGQGFNFIIDLFPEGDGSAPRITWQQPLGELPLSELLNRIVRSADRPLDYAVEDYAVVFRNPTGSTAPALFTRRYRLSHEALRPHLEQVLGKPLGNNPPDAGVALRSYLIQCGLSFPEAPRDGNPPQEQPAMYYNLGQGILFVRANEADLQKLETILAAISPPPAQIQLETTIHEISAEAHGRLQLASEASNFQTGPQGSRASFLLRPSDARQLRAQLDALPGVTQSAAPKITTLSARMASLRIHPPDAAPGTEDLALDFFPAVEADTGHIALTVLGFEPWTPAEPGEPKPNVVTVPRVVHSQQFAGIPDQHTAVLIGQGSPLPDGTRRRRILLITPTLIDPAGNAVNPEPR
jgi:beta-lactamase regulating signal transducer with metallopeptidase domain